MADNNNNPSRLYVIPQDDYSSDSDSEVVHVMEMDREESNKRKAPPQSAASGVATRSRAAVAAAAAPASPSSKKKEKHAKGKNKKSKFKKNPNAPKRFRSAFIMFSQQRHSEIREQLKAENSDTNNLTGVAKMVSQEWKDMVPEQREYWKELARKDMERFEKEKAAFRGSWKVSTNEWQNDPTRPKKPSPAYFAFSNARRQEAKQKHPDASNAELSKILSKMWEEAPKALKQCYIDEEARQREIYVAKFEEWRKNKDIAPPEEELQRRKAIEAASKTPYQLGMQQQLQQAPSQQQQFPHQFPQLPPNLTTPQQQQMQMQMQQIASLLGIPPTSMPPTTTIPPSTMMPPTWMPPPTMMPPSASLPPPTTMPPSPSIQTTPTPTAVPPPVSTPPVAAMPVPTAMPPAAIPTLQNNLWGSLQQSAPPASTNQQGTAPAPGPQNPTNLGEMMDQFKRAQHQVAMALGLPANDQALQQANAMLMEQFFRAQHQGGGGGMIASGFPTVDTSAAQQQQPNPAAVEQLMRSFVATENPPKPLPPPQAKETPTAQFPTLPQFNQNSQQDINNIIPFLTLQNALSVLQQQQQQQGTQNQSNSAGIEGVASTMADLGAVLNLHRIQNQGATSTHGKSTDYPPSNRGPSTTSDLGTQKMPSRAAPYANPSMEAALNLLLGQSQHGGKGVGFMTNHQDVGLPQCSPQPNIRQESDSQKSTLIDLLAEQNELLRRIANNSSGQTCPQPATTINSTGVQPSCNQQPTPQAVLQALGMLQHQQQQPTSTAAIPQTLPQATPNSLLQSFLQQSLLSQTQHQQQPAPAPPPPPPQQQQQQQQQQNQSIRNAAPVPAPVAADSSQQPQQRVSHASGNNPGSNQIAPGLLALTQLVMLSSNQQQQNGSDGDSSFSLSSSL